MISPSEKILAVLEFSSLPMLGWLVAAALPWLIHRWYRRRHQTTPWAAIELLLTAMKQQARRIQMQQWLLLAVRTAILVLVALAVAQPVLRQWAIGASVGGRSQMHQVIVLDQTYSMGCEQQGTSRWQRAKSSAQQMIESCDGDAVTLIGWAGRSENLLGRPTFDSSVALSVLEDLQLSDASGDLLTVLQSVLAGIDRAEAELPRITQHEVVFVTDLNRPTWQVDQRRRELLSQVAERANVRLVNVAEGQSSNLAITELRVEPVVTLSQREASVLVTVHCYGEVPATQPTMELLIEGQSIEQQQIELRRGESRTVRFDHRFVDKGKQTIHVRLTDNVDCLSSDDERWMVVDVQARLRVACFARQPGAVDDLARALSPSGELAANSGAIAPEVFSISRLGEVDLSEYAVVLLGGVEDLSAREVASLTEYVRQGGGLAVFLGDEKSSASLPAFQSLLPVRIDGTQPAGEYRFDPLEYRHPIVAPFRGQAQAGLLGVTITQFRQLKLLADRPSAEVVLHFDTGDPALVVDQFGLGRIAVSALPGSLAARTVGGTPWSSFALSPSFLPVVRELVVHLVGDRWQQQQNLSVGKPAVFPWVGTANSASVRLPSGTSQALLTPGAEDHGLLTFQATDRQGIYHFDADNQELSRFAVNLDGKDSDPAAIDAASLPAGFAEATVQAASTLRLTGDEYSLTRTLLAVAAALLLLEIGLAYLLGKGWG